MVPFDRAYMTSYSRIIVTMGLKSKIKEIPGPKDQLSKTEKI